MTATPPSSRTAATRRRWRGRGRSRGRRGLEHRVGGLEKADVTGAVSYDADNHQTMVDLRAAKIAGIDVPDLEVDDATGDASTLVVGWGSTYGSNAAAVRRLRARGGARSRRPTSDT